MYTGCSNVIELSIKLYSRHVICGYYRIGETQKSDQQNYAYMNVY